MNINTKLKKIMGFTLAEVLITLGIIGVVAAITIPTMITKNQEKQNLVKLKKAYAEIAQALKLAVNENGANINISTETTERNHNLIENYFKPYMKIMDVCEPSSSVCWTDEPKNGDGTSAHYALNTISTHYSFTTIGGYSVYFWTSRTDSLSDNTDIQMYIDVNGVRGPNTVGKDIFHFAWRENNWEIPSVLK